ncbi:MAG: DUF177 domain-containing protein [Candidatus Omnitrophica bacterium]|jgi:uncharacterized protein|nr:DUF177 domain-containing protein [Candidatus Omnitrophota bacterium]
MRIEVSKIKEEEIELIEDTDASSWDLSSFDVKFTGKIHLRCIFSRIGQEIIVNAEATSNREILCSRCLTETHQTVKQDFKLFFNVNDLGNILDIDNALREELLLNFPMKVLCSPACKGLCAGCNANLNIEECRCKNR